MRRALSRLGSLLALAFLAGAGLPAQAQMSPGLPPALTQGVEGVLTGTLAAVKTTGTVKIGYREASMPFSYLNRAGQPIGYSIDICAAIVEEISREIDRADLHIQYVPVTSDNRLQAIADGRIDLECGSTTANAERRKQVSFSPMIFVAGTKVMVPRGTRWTSFRDLKGKRVVVTKGTTNEQTMKKLDEKFALGLTLIEAGDHNLSFQTLAEGKADAFALDDVLLAGLIAQNKADDKFMVAGELLSYDPYGIGYRLGDAGMTHAIDKAFKALVDTGDMNVLYNKWFMQRLPGGERFNLPMSAQLEESFETMRAQAEGN